MRSGYLKSREICRIVVLAILMALLPGAAFAQLASWHFNSLSSADNGASVFALGYGTAETYDKNSIDDLIFSVSCSNSVVDLADKRMTIIAQASVAHRTSSGPIELLFLAGNTPMQLGVVPLDEIGALVQFLTVSTIDRTFWSALARENTLQFGVPDGKVLAVDLTAGRGKIEKFLQECSVLYGVPVAAQFQQQAPSVQAPVAVAQTNVAQTTVVQNILPPAVPNAQTDDSFSFEQGLALGAAAVGVAIIANEAIDSVNESFFTEAEAPRATVSTSDAVMQVNISSVRAIETTFGFGGDEVFLLFSNGVRFPSDPNAAQDIDAGQIWNPGASVKAVGSLSVDLREWDSFNASDLIGNFSINTDQGPGQYTQSLNGDGAVYEVTYTVSMNGEGGQIAPAPQPVAQVRSWSATGVGNSIIVADCQDCDEDIGFLLQCQGVGLPALVEVPWLALEQGPAGAGAALNVNVDGQVFSYTARLSDVGLVGFVPSFQLNANDPLFRALQAGNSAQMHFAGQTATIGLRGSRAALQSFNNNCGWQNVAQAPQPTNVPTQPKAQFVWFGSQYNSAETGRPTLSLTLGVPETDATGFQASCAIGSGTIGVDMIVGLGNYSHGTPVNAYVQAAGNSFQFLGQVFISNSEWAGVHANVAAGNPVWRAMSQAGASFSYGIVGGRGRTDTAQGLGQMLGQFIAGCRQASPAGQAQQPAQQPVQQRAQNQQGQNAQGGAQVTDFACNDGSQMRVTVGHVGTGTAASISRNGGAPFTLQGVAPQGGNTTYSDRVATLEVAGSQVRFTAPNIRVLCQVN